MDRGVANGAQSIDRAVSIWRQVGRRGNAGVTLAELVAHTGLVKPTVRRILLALMRAGLVEQDDRTRRYYPGADTYVMGMLAAPRFGLSRIVQPALIRLARATGDSSFLTVPRGNHAICLHREEGSYPVRTHALQAGDEHPLGIGAGSLAILAAMPDHDRVIEEIGPLLTGIYAAYSPQILRDCVARAREQGYALNPGYIIANSWGIGVPIRHPLGHIAGAISIAAIDQRLQPERQRELAALIRAEAAHAEQQLNVLFTGET